MGVQFAGAVDLAQIGTPGAPATDRALFYAKGDGRVYKQTSDGREQLVDDHGVNNLGPCRAATYSVLTLSGAQTIDGVACVAGDRVLVMGQTAAADNGIYVVAAGAWTRATDANTAAKMMRGTQVAVLEGPQWRGHTFTQVVTLTTLGTDQIIWRIVMQLDLVNAFTFPAPQGIGHAVFNGPNKSITVWDGYGWRDAYGASLCTSTTRPSFIGEGYQIYETDTGLSYIFDGTDWKLIGGGSGGGSGGSSGTVVLAYAANANAQGVGTADTTWTADSAGARAVATFTAPPSGKVKISYSAYVGNLAAAGNTGNVYAGLGWSGGVIRDPTDLETVGVARGQVVAISSRDYVVEGLTPGTSYTLTSMHKTDGTANAYINFRTIVVEAVGDLATSVGAVTAKLSTTTVQSITPSSTWTRMVVDTKAFDTANMANPTTGQITIPTTGKYAVFAYASFALSAAVGARRLLGIGKNWSSGTPSANIIASVENAGDSAANAGVTYYEVLDLVAGDVLTPLFWQNSGGALNTYISAGVGNTPYFGVSMITGMPGSTGTDTGPQPITPAAGVSGLFTYRAVNGWVYVEGVLTFPSLAAGATATVAAVGAIPAAYRPASSIYVPGRGGAGSFGLQIGRYTDGSITVVNTTGAAITTAQLVMSYPMVDPGAPIYGPSAVDTGWITPTFTNGWTNYSGAFNQAGYRRIGNQVFLRGLVVGTTGAANPMFTLPVGFRPTSQNLLTAGNQVTTSSAASAGTAHTHTVAAVSTRLNVTAAGLVSVEATTASNAYTSLDGVSFFID
jgi:hypothetical protein